MRHLDIQRTCSWWQMNNIQDIPRRNAESVFQALTRMETKFVEQQQLVGALQNTVSELLMRVRDLETRMAAIKVSMIGRGPTVV